MDFSTFEQTISQGFQHVVGDATLVGLLVLFVFLVWIVFNGLNLTVGLMILIPLIILLAAGGWLPVWLVFLVIIFLGIAAGVAIRNQFAR